jgi:di/tricarboxylate transporter
MGFEAWFAILVVVVLFVALQRNFLSPDILFIFAVSIFASFGMITPAEALSGFSNEGMLTVAALFVVAAGLRETGILNYIGQGVFGGALNVRSVFLRLTGVVLPMSAFLNNTPIVAMFQPIIIDWSKRNGVSPSKLLIPLSFIAILGGTCTLIGTSTNLVINGLMLEEHMEPMGLFEIALIGIPYALLGVLYLFFFAQKLLPDRKDLFEKLGDSRREYLSEMIVEPDSRLIGQMVEAAGLRGLPGLFLIEIERDGELFAPVRPDHVIKAGDRMVFTGIVSSIVELEKFPGLTPVEECGFEISTEQKHGRRLWEAVVSNSSPLIGQTIRDSDFRATYGAAVVAVHRGEKRLEKTIGDIMLRPGDTLLLRAGRHFRRAFKNDPSFYLVSDVSEWRPLREEYVKISSVIFLALIVVMGLGLMPIVVACMLAASLMVVSGCLSPSDARRSIDWQVLITISAAFGVGAALQNSGAATAIASELVAVTKPFGPTVALGAIYMLGAIMTALITNNAAAVILFPFCLETSRLLEVSPIPFLVALMLASSSSFMTPIGYQTNMMVYGPGGYRFKDFLKVGTPLTILLWLMATFTIPLIWSF